MIGKTTVARAMQAIRSLSDYLAAKTPKPSVTGDAGSADGSPLSTWRDAADIEASKSRRSPEELEHIELACLARDYRYANRSRRFLYTQAYQEKFRNAYDLFLVFAKENYRYDMEGIVSAGQADPAKLLNKNLRDLQVTPFKP